MTTSNSFSSAKPAAADAHTLALIASSLVAATAVAFLAMVFTAWPASAEDARTLRLAALPPSVLAEDLARAVPAPAAPEANAAPHRTAALGTLPLAARPCLDEVADSEAAMNASLARAEQAEETDPAGQCTAFTAHVASLDRAAQAVNRCMTGAEREAKARLLRRASIDWRTVVANGCR